MLVALQRRGYAVEVATNGREALDRLTRERFALVLMDVQKARDCLRRFLPAG